MRTLGRGAVILGLELLQEQMSVAAAEAETVDTGPARQFIDIGRPGRRLRPDGERGLFDFKTRIRGREVGLRRKRLVLQGLA